MVKYILYHWFKATQYYDTDMMGAALNAEDIKHQRKMGT